MEEGTFKENGLQDEGERWRGEHERSVERECESAGEGKGREV